MQLHLELMDSHTAQCVQDHTPVNTPNPSCGYFRSVRGKGQNRPLLEILDEFKSSQWRSRILALRQLTDKKARNAEKKKLPAVMFSASTRKGGHRETDLADHTGLLQIDIDNLHDFDAAIALRERLRKDPHLFASWLSPGGFGVKALIRVSSSLAMHRVAFVSAQQWFRDTHDVPIDVSCSDPCRLCFVSYDPDLWINPDATELPVGLAAADQPNGEVSPPESSAASLPSASCHLPTASCILHNHETFQQFPSLRPFYRKLVTERFPTMQPGLRNDALCDLVPRLYSAVHPRFILPFAKEFYQDHRAVFNDPLTDHLKEAASLLRGTERDFARIQLSDEERAAYALAPDDRHQCAFRVCHALAVCPSDDCPPPFFFLSAEKLAHRLGCLDMQAWRILRWCEKAGVILEVMKGERRTKGGNAQASRYRWLLPSKFFMGSQ